MNADPEVMEHFPKPLTRRESDDFVDRIDLMFDKVHFGLWVIETRDQPGFGGYVGLWPATFEAHFTPAIEIGWRLPVSHWGFGYATEAATAALADGFDRLPVSEIVSFTAEVNRRSIAVMERLGMQRDPSEDFAHPALPPDHRLSQHVLYRLQRAQAPA